MNQAAALTKVTGAGEEVDHERGLGQLRQDGVVRDQQHLLVEAEGQLSEGRQVRVRPLPLGRPGYYPRPHQPAWPLPCA